MHWYRATQYWLVGYRRTWRASIASGFIAPVLFLASFGFGLGSLVRGGGDVAGVPYVAFIAPGILAANAMQTAIGDATYPVLTSTKWNRHYFVQLSSPLTTTDMVLGHLAYMGLRIGLGALAFLVVGACLGAFTSPWVILAVPVVIACGLAHAAPVMAFAVRQTTDGQFFLVYRFIMTPVFLFAGTFFPVSQLPVGLEWLAWLTPLWHATSLARDLSLGGATVLTSLGHLAYLAVWVVGGTALAVRTYRSVLVT
jgi:lipooligosaccharide transport system permease protein